MCGIEGNTIIYPTAHDDDQLADNARLPQGGNSMPRAGCDEEIDELQSKEAGGAAAAQEEGGGLPPTTTQRHSRARILRTVSRSRTL